MKLPHYNFEKMGWGLKISAYLNAEKFVKFFIPNSSPEELYRALKISTRQVNMKMSIVKLLIESGAPLKSILSDAVAFGDESLVKVLIEHGADVDYRLKFRNQTALFGAVCLPDRLHLAKILVENGADINAEDSTGLTPLIIAVINGNLEMVEYFKSTSGDVYYKTQDGYTAVDYALLASISPNLNHKNQDGYISRKIKEILLN